MIMYSPEQRTNVPKLVLWIPKFSLEDTMVRASRAKFSVTWRRNANLIRLDTETLEKMVVFRTTQVTGRDQSQK